MSVKSSTWNVDNYFWEEHNCNNWAKKRLEELAQGITADGWQLIEISFPHIEANRSIRKNKEIRSFEFTFECKFKFNSNPEPKPEDKPMEGKIRFPDVSNDACDSPDDWEFDLSFTGESNDKTAAEKKVVRVSADKNVIPKIRQAFATFASEFKGLPSQ